MSNCHGWGWGDGVFHFVADGDGVNMQFFVWNNDLIAAEPLKTPGLDKILETRVQMLFSLVYQSVVRKPISTFPLSFEPSLFLSWLAL